MTQNQRYVVAFNASPRKDGNTARLIRYALSKIEEQGIKTELVHIGGKQIHGCIACAKCWENQDRHCALTKDVVNDCIDKMIHADGIIIGSPTYFSDITPEAKALIDRAGFVSIANGGLFTRKVGAGIAAVRRAGAVAALDSINHLFGICDMFTAGSTYWNLGIGLEPGDVDKDEEGIKTMERLGENIAWFITQLKN
ncbi:MAG TPA: flavodoxin family protein [Methanospirillum sp.]|uniref:flavodoxin family protein n=1 Tax=Methanospirillum sp. TaxID=45200 RepID=UPI002CFF51D4|nr:flavodoxin family protein [Methanospirillum sp.]HWQ63075.1 flavodoxin family protein [Methanospirillum sp.]